MHRAHCASSGMKQCRSFRDPTIAKMAMYAVEAVPLPWRAEPGCDLSGQVGAHGS